MKKILISILVVLLAVLTYFLIMEDVHIADWKNKNIDDIKSLNAKLDKKIDIVEQMNYQEYPEKIKNLETSIEELKIAKDKYDSKVNSLTENVELGVVEIKEYKIERLWIALENYAKDENVKLKLEVLDTAAEGIYDLNVTVVGEYIGITDFIYDIEKDDTLGFKILNFKLIPNTNIVTTATQETDANDDNTSEDSTQTKNNSTASVDVNELKATFKIEGVGIEFN